MVSDEESMERYSMVLRGWRLETTNSVGKGWDAMPTTAIS